jgi:hypothetical protein
MGAERTESGAKAVNAQSEAPATSTYVQHYREKSPIELLEIARGGEPQSARNTYYTSAAMLKVQELASEEHLGLQELHFTHVRRHNWRIFWATAALVVCTLIAASTPFLFRIFGWIR